MENFEIGLVLAIFAHFGAVVWWGSQLTANVKALTTALTSLATKMEGQQESINSLAVRLAVQEAQRP